VRKLKLQVQMSLDGFVGRPDGGLDWMTWDWDDQLKNMLLI
jgi:dihydrofolate reductase